MNSINPPNIAAKRDIPISTPEAGIGDIRISRNFSGIGGGGIGQMIGQVLQMLFSMFGNSKADDGRLISDKTGGNEFNPDKYNEDGIVVDPAKYDCKNITLDNVSDRGDEALLSKMEELLTKEGGLTKDEEELLAAMIEEKTIRQLENEYAKSIDEINKEKPDLLANKLEDNISQVVSKADVENASELKDRLIAYTDSSKDTEVASSKGDTYEGKGDTEKVSKDTRSLQAKLPENKANEEWITNNDLTQLAA